MGEVIRKVKGGKFVGWYLRFVDADGRRKQRASKQPSHAEARRMLIEIEARIARGMVGMEERQPQKTLTVEELFRRFVEESSNPKVKDAEKYRERVRIQLQRVSKEASAVAHLSLSALSPSHLGTARDALCRRYPAGTVRTTLIAVSAALSWAVREGLIEKNLASGVQRPPAPASRLDFLTAPEVRRLLEEAERRAADTGKHGLAWRSRRVAISLAIHTGMRKGELFGLRWEDVDLTGQRLTIAHSYATTPKSGKARHVRLPSALFPLLQEWRERCPSSQFVCPVWHGGKWGMVLNPSCEHKLPQLLAAAGCVGKTRPWHLLRHTFASHFVQNGGSLLALSKILGHSDVKVTMIYAHLGKEFLDGEMERVKF